MTQAVIEKYLKIPVKIWEDTRNNPNYAELIEEIEDRMALLKASKIKGPKISFRAYLDKRKK